MATREGDLDSFFTLSIVDCRFFPTRGRGAGAVSRRATHESTARTLRHANKGTHTKARKQRHARKAAFLFMFPIEIHHFFIFNRRIMSPLFIFTRALHTSKRSVPYSGGYCCWCGVDSPAACRPCTSTRTRRSTPNLVNFGDIPRKVQLKAEHSTSLSCGAAWNL